jgi:hypothetical protein
MIGVEPCGRLALTVAGLATIGYSVYAGGEHLDWYRMEHLNLVDGVRTVIDERLQ